MKKLIAVYSILSVSLILLLGALGYTVMHDVYVQEINTVQNLAGAVITQYPNTETAFAEALYSQNREQIAAGTEILSGYGYDGEERLSENPKYRRMIWNFFSILTGLLLVLLLCGYLFFFACEKKRKSQEEQLLSALESCLSEDYRFIRDLKQLDEYENPQFSDTLVKLGEKLRLKTEALNEERDYTKSLVTDISHQLKTPISALKTCFSMYVEADTPQEKEEFQQRCKIQMDKLESLTSSLVQISRLETDMITIKKETTTLTDILIGAMNIVYDKARKKGMEIIIDDFEEMPLLLDEKWTAEAVANILDNAVKYSPKGSEIQIRVQKLYSFVRIEVEDSGIGIPKEERNQIFRRFYRGENETVKNEEGSGVGLYLARRIFEEQGGTVSVYSAKSKGSIFVIQLPL